MKRWHAYGLMFLAILALAGLCLSGAALAGEFPDKSVKIIVPLKPDGGGEQGVRPLEKDFKEGTEQPLLFVYKPGGTVLDGRVDFYRQMQKR